MSPVDWSGKGEVDADVLRARLRAVPAAAPVLAGLGDEPSAYAVGGAVRDLLLGRVPAEVDVVVEGDGVAAAQRAARRLGVQARPHARFGTATVLAPDGPFDVASSRRERYERPGDLPEVELGVPVDEDLRRRDFSVNALALPLRDGPLRAFPGALEDLRAGRLRVLHPRSFADDPTRLLRLARYAARLGFAIAPDTERLAHAALDAGALDTVSGPRLGNELRLAAAEPDAGGALQALDALGAARALHPALAVDPARVARAVALCPPDARADLAALAAACLDIGPGELHAWLERLGFPAADRDAVVGATAHARALAGALASATGARPSELARVVRGRRPETVAVAGALSGADAARRWLDELRHVRLEIGGDDLLAAGAVPGPALGRALRAALAAKLDGAAPDRAAELRVALDALRRA